MSSSLLSLYNLDGGSRRSQEVPFSTLPSREEALSALRENPNVDLLILGGGVTGALVAHWAALQDIKVLLLEGDFFGSHSISWRHHVSRTLRSRPLAVLRDYLPLNTIRRNPAFSHLVSEAEGDAHSFSARIASLAERITPQFDVDERLLLRESVLAARQEGAFVFSSVAPVYLEAEALSGCYEIEFKDERSSQTYKVRVGGVFVDPSRGHLPTTRLGSSVLRVEDSRPGGVQRVYEVTPTTAKSGAAFVSFELTDGSYVAVTRLAHDRVEATVLYGAVALDDQVIIAICDDACREAGWNIHALRSTRAVDSTWACSYAFRQERGIFTCSHRAPWDAFRSADRVVRDLLALRESSRRRPTLPHRALPGVEQAREVDVFRAAARGQGISESSIELCVKRWRGRVRYLAQFPGGLQEVFPGVLKGEIALACRSDHARTAQEVALGSLRLDREGDWRQALPVIEKFLSECLVSEA